jgi:hypothetical protein
MNAGITEEVGATSRSFMAAMGSQPVMLGMVIVVLAMIAMLWFTLNFAATARKNEFEMIFAQQKEVQAILSRCVVVPDAQSLSKAKAKTPKFDPFKLQSADEEVRIVPLKPLPPDEVAHTDLPTKPDTVHADSPIPQPQVPPEEQR